MARRKYNAWKSYVINITFNVSCLAYSFPHPFYEKGTVNISHGVPSLPLRFLSQLSPQKKKTTTTMDYMLIRLFAVT